MKFFAPAFLAALAAGLLSLGGCAVGPDYKQPAPPKAGGYTGAPLPAKTSSVAGPGGEAQLFVRGMDIPAQWWTLFQSRALNALIDDALKNNPDVQAAQAALRAAQENALAQRGAWFPFVDAGASASRQKIAEKLSSSTPLPSGALLFSLKTAQVNVSYTPDVFGLNRRTAESLEAAAEAQRFQAEATYLTLTSNVVSAAVQEAALREQIAALHEVIKLDKETLDILRRQFALGQVAQTDVALQESALAQAEQGLPPLQKQLAHQRDLLATLAGRFPGEKSAATFDLSALRLPHKLPVTLPAKLVEQRPDIRVAEANLKAASAGVGVATANMLPNISLGAAGGSSTDGVLFTSGAYFWNLTAGLAQPIFHGGELLHKKRAAEATYDQAAAQYRSTVVTAFQNVSDTLRALQYDADAMKAAALAEHKTRDVLKLTRRQLQLGSVSYLALLNAQQAFQQAKISLIQAKAARYADTVALFQALGGGWWSRETKGRIL